MVRTLTKKEALADFKENILPFIKKRYEQDGRIDYPARREAWNNYTDSLCKDGQITPKQYATWACPW